MKSVRPSFAARFVLLALLGAAAPAAWSAGSLLEAPPSVDALDVRPETAFNGIALSARWSGDWGRMQARAATLRQPDGRIVSATRAWWQTDLPSAAAQLRLGSQQAAATFARNAFDLTGVGLAGRFAPALADYALAIGRQQAMGPMRAPEDRTGFAVLRRALGGSLQFGLHAMRQGPWEEVGALLEGIGIGPWSQRLGLLQTRSEGREQERLVIGQQLKLGGVVFSGRTEQVLDDCASAILMPTPAPLPPMLSGGCSAWRGDANVPIDSRWRLLVGAGARRDGDDALTRQLSLGTAWQAPGGARLMLLLQREAGAVTKQRVDASLAWNFGGGKLQPPGKPLALR